MSAILYHFGRRVGMDGVGAPLGRWQLRQRNGSPDAREATIGKRRQWGANRSIERSSRADPPSERGRARRSARRPLAQHVHLDWGSFLSACAPTEKGREPTSAVQCLARFARQAIHLHFAATRGARKAKLCFPSHSPLDPGLCWRAPLQLSELWPGDAVHALFGS